MTLPLPDIGREHFAPGGGDAFLFYAIYGRVAPDRPLSPSAHRSNGVPDGVTISSYGPETPGNVPDELRIGYLWDQLCGNDPDLAAKVAAQDTCLILRGEIADPPTLNYFRDAIGVLTYLLDGGGVAIYDPQMFCWWSPEAWRRGIVDSATIKPERHVCILTSVEPDGSEWFHTRGLRKFGRRDLSLHGVTSQYRDAVIDLFNRFIELLAKGGIIQEGQEIRMRSLPPGMTCLLRGHLDDPDFNNSHVEILWPSVA